MGKKIKRKNRTFNRNKYIKLYEAELKRTVNKSLRNILQNRLRILHEGSRKEQNELKSLINRENSSLTPSKQIAIYERRIKVSINTTEQEELRRRINILSTGFEEEILSLTKSIRLETQASKKIQSSQPKKTRERGRWASIVGGGATGLKR